MVFVFLSVNLKTQLLNIIYDLLLLKNLLFVTEKFCSIEVVNFLRRLHGFFIRLDTLRIILCRCLNGIFKGIFSRTYTFICVSFSIFMFSNPCLLLISNCTIPKTIKADKIIMITNSVSRESFTSSRFKIGNLLL